jgi:hypothetical protein
MFLFCSPKEKKLRRKTELKTYDATLIAIYDKDFFPNDYSMNLSVDQGVFVFRG